MGSSCSVCAGDAAKNSPRQTDNETSRNRPRVPQFRSVASRVTYQSRESEWLQEVEQPSPRGDLMLHGGVSNNASSASQPEVSFHHPLASPSAMMRSGDSRHSGGSGMGRLETLADSVDSSILAATFGRANSPGRVSPMPMHATSEDNSGTANRQSFHHSESSGGSGDPMSPSGPSASGGPQLQSATNSGLASAGLHSPFVRTSSGFFMKGSERDAAKMRETTRSPENHTAPAARFGSMHKKPSTLGRMPMQPTPMQPTNDGSGSSSVGGDAVAETHPNVPTDAGSPTIPLAPPPLESTLRGSSLDASHSQAVMPRLRSQDDLSEPNSSHNNTRYGDIPVIEDSDADDSGADDVEDIGGSASGTAVEEVENDVRVELAAPLVETKRDRASSFGQKQQPRHGSDPSVLLKTSSANSGVMLQPQRSGSYRSSRLSSPLGSRAASPFSNNSFRAPSPRSGRAVVFLGSSAGDAPAEAAQPLSGQASFEVVAGDSQVFGDSINTPASALSPVSSSAPAASFATADALIVPPPSSD